MVWDQAELKACLPLLKKPDWFRVVRSGARPQPSVPLVGQDGVDLLHQQLGRARFTVDGSLDDALHQGQVLLLETLLAFKSASETTECQSSACLTWTYFVVAFNSSYLQYQAPVTLFGWQWRSPVIWMHWEGLRVISREYLCYKVTVGKISVKMKQCVKTLSAFILPIKP